MWSNVLITPVRYRIYLPPLILDLEILLPPRNYTNKHFRSVFHMEFIGQSGILFFGGGYNMRYSSI